MKYIIMLDVVILLGSLDQRAFSLVFILVGLSLFRLFLFDPPFSV
jgi:hypothetical protein